MGAAVTAHLRALGATDSCRQALHAARAEEWHRWASTALQDGGRRGHAWTKDPKAWAPHVVQDGEGTSAHPDAVADNQADRFRTLWQADTLQGEDSLPPPEDRRCLATLTPQEMRASASSWSWATAVGTDGFRMRHQELLPDDALEALATFF